MNLENIIVCAICLVAIAIVGYFMYTKVTAQNQEMFKLSKRCEAIEMMFARPPPPDDLQAMYRPKYVAEKPVSDHLYLNNLMSSYEDSHTRIPSVRCSGERWSRSQLNLATLGELEHLLVLSCNLGVHEVTHNGDGDKTYRTHYDIFQVHFLIPT